MIVEHLNGTETLLGIAAIAGLFAIRKYLFCNFDESDHIICRGSQTVRHANLIAGVKIPEESNCLLRDVVARQLVSKEKAFPSEHVFTIRIVLSALIICGMT